MEERGIISWVHADVAYTDKRGTYLSGLFGVVKPNKYTINKRPVLRVIMNLIPLNGLFQVLRGDINYLPSATQWLPIFLQSGDQITRSQADMSAAFYLFELPVQWQKYMCFNFSVKGHQLGFTGDAAFKLYRPTCRVLPMGWSSSVGIMQAISREVLLSRGLPEDREIRRGVKPPPWFTQAASAATESRAWWQVYLDNFLSELRESSPTMWLYSRKLWRHGIQLEF